MIEHCIQSLEKVLNPLKKDKSLDFLIETQNYIVNGPKIFQRLKDPLKEFQDNFKNLKEKQIDRILKNFSQILGYGLGSTPESDDLFLGILIAKYCLNKKACEIFEYLTNLPFEKFTTSKSAQLIRSFLNQNFPPEILTFIELLKIQIAKNEVIIKFEYEIRKIKTLGTSSGYYFLLGVLWELRHHSRYLT